MTTNPEPGQALFVGAVVAETYQVTRLLGRGGMGSVWEASHLRLPGKKVAIKVLHADIAADQEALARFRREAEIATRLGHPNIVEVHDFNSLPGGQPYLVLELLVGESLDSRLRRAPVSLDDAMRIAGQIGAALAAAHRQDVIHRDLKPQNVFLVRPRLDEAEEGGEIAKVLDFGISKIRGSQTVKTLDSTILGTPQYMAPEQATGNHAAVDARTDVFALAAIVYEMLAGRPAFSGQSIPEVVFKVVYEQPPPLADLVPGIPPRVTDAVSRALSKKQDERFPDVVTFVEQMAGVSISTLRRAPLSLAPAPATSRTLAAPPPLTPRRTAPPAPAADDALAHTIDSGRRPLEPLPSPPSPGAPSPGGAATRRGMAPFAPPAAPPPSEAGGRPAPTADHPEPFPGEPGPGEAEPGETVRTTRRRAWLAAVAAVVAVAGGAAALFVVRVDRDQAGPATSAVTSGPAPRASEPAANAPGAAAGEPSAATSEPSVAASEPSVAASEPSVAASEPSAASGAAGGPGLATEPNAAASGPKAAASGPKAAPPVAAKPPRKPPSRLASERPASPRDDEDDDDAIDSTGGPRRAELLEGEEALRAGDPRRALVLAERALRNGAGALAHVLRANASCALGDLGNAKASFLSIPRRHPVLRRRVITFCARNGVDLRP